MKEQIQEERNHFIDALKGICILFVIITHFSWSDEERLKFLFPFWIDMAVPIFMIISGYVYAISYKKHNIANISAAYSLKNIDNKLIRYTIPFAGIFIAEQILSEALKPGSLDFSGLGLLFLRGGTEKEAIIIQ